jgi:hypothetical protein
VQDLRPIIIVTITIQMVEKQYNGIKESKHAEFSGVVRLE